MTKGYQIIEAPELDKLVRHSKNAAVAVALIEWLIEMIEAEHSDKFQGVELDTIMARYLGGAYPVIGIHYVSECTDLEPLVLDAIRRILRESRVLEFVTFMANNPIHWVEMADRLRHATETETT